MGTENDEFSRADYHLQIWGNWRRQHKGVVGHGFDSRAAVLSTGGSQEFDHMADAADARSARICDGIIDEMPNLWRHSLEFHYILQGTWKYNRDPTEDVLADAQYAFWKIARRYLA